MMPALLVDSPKVVKPFLAVEIWEDLIKAINSFVLYAPTSSQQSTKEWEQAYSLAGLASAG